MNVIIAGSRHFMDYEEVEKQVGIVIPLDFEHTLLCGMADGADAMGLKLAQNCGWTVKEFRADWEQFGKAAGPVRNRLMAVEGDILFAFWDNVSRGTKNMIKTALDEGIEVHVYQSLAHK